MTVIIGFLLALFMPATTALVEQQKRKETTVKMANVEQALLAYILTNRRLPCPADGTMSSGNAGVGVEARDANGDCTAQATGVLPWATLGLAEADVTDAWNARLTFRVADGGLGFTRNSAMDASQCDPAGSAPRTASGGSTPSACVAGCNHSLPNTCTGTLNLLVNRGLSVVDEAGNFLAAPASGTGAAYVMISPMAEGGGGYSSSGILQTPSVVAGTNGEDRNMNGQAIPAAGFFHDSRILPGSGAGVAHFDDQLVHPTVMQILTKAQLTPRAQ